MKNKKIFFLADAKSIHTVKWIDYFVAKNYEVHLATFASINNTKCRNIYFLSKNKSSVRGGNYHYLLSVLKLAKILKEIKPDVVNAHYSYSMGLIAYLAIKKSKIETSSSIVCHGSDVLATPFPFLFDKINRFLLKRVDEIFVVSDQIRDRLIEWSIQEEKIFVGQYGIETKELNNSYRDIDILSNRTYCSNSRIDFLLEALNKYKDKNLNIIFILPTVDDDTFERVQKEYPFVKFYKYVQYDEMMEMLTSTKIYISATQSDGTSLSLLEAMWSGATPLVSNIVSNRSWVLDGVNGFLFGHKDEFVDKLEKILDSDAMQKDISIINKKIVDEKADYKKQMKKIEEFLI